MWYPSRARLRQSASYGAKPFQVQVQWAVRYLACTFPIDIARQAAFVSVMNRSAHPGSVSAPTSATCARRRR